MAITFNSSAIDGGLAATGIYAHIIDVAGPKKTDADADEGISESWHVAYGVICHKDASTRNADEPGWRDRIPARRIDRFKWEAANLDSYPTMAVLYSHLKTQIASIATSIADA
jgi:hypothetical protein